MTHDPARRYAELAISRAPDHIRKAINVRRIEMGLDPVLGHGELQAVHRAADTALAAAKARAVREATVAAGASSASARFRVSRATPTTTKTITKTITRVILSVGAGLARCRADGVVVGDWTQARAYGSPDDLNRGRCWQLRDGHGGELVDMVGPTLRALPSDAVPLLIEWIPSLVLRRHREIVARIESGDGGVSAETNIYDEGISRLPSPTRVIRRAGLTAIALLQKPERPAFPGAWATVFRGPDTPDELRRQIAEAEAVAARRSSMSETAYFHRHRTRG